VSLVTILRRLARSARSESRVLEPVP